MKIVKSSLTLLISILFLFTSFAQKSNVTISGTIQDNTFNSIQLLSIQNNNQEVYGEATIDQDGNFKLQGLIPEPDIYRLSFSPKEYVLCCLNPNETITLGLNAGNLSELISVNGSKSMALTKELSDTYQSRKDILDDINQTMRDDKEQIYFSQINKEFAPFQRSNKDIDNYVINAFSVAKELMQTVNRYSEKGKVKKGKEDSLIYLANNQMKSFINDYQKFTSYMINIRPTYNFPPYLNDQYADYNKFLTRYVEVLDERHQLLINTMNPFFESLSKLIEERDQMITSGKTDDKKSKGEFLTSLIDLASKNQEVILKSEGEYLIKAQVSENLSKDIIDGAQERISAIVKEYQLTFDQENEKINAKLLELIRSNKDDLAIMMFIDIFPKEQNMELHKMVADALYAKYPNNKMVASKYQQMNSPANSTAIGAVAPNIALQNPDGKILNLSDLRGKYVLIDFWASWCGPCRRENPHVVEMYNKYKEKGFEVFSVSLDRTKEAWVRAIETDKLTWPNHVSDLKYWSSEAAKLYGVNSIPATFLIDKEGRIIAKNLRGAELTNALRKIFGE